MDFRFPMHVVAPTLDGDVLRVLAGAEGDFTGRQVHALVSHGSPEGVRQALKRLVAQGIVDERPAGRALLYRLNRDHVAAPWVEGLAQLRQQVVERLRSEVAGWAVQPVVAAIFGSVARGEAGPQSDLDLLFVRPADADRDAWDDQIASLVDRATRWTGNEARALEVGEEELAAHLADEPVFEDILEQGIVLAGSMRVLRRLDPR